MISVAPEGRTNFAFSSVAVAEVAFWAGHRSDYFPKDNEFSVIAFAELPHGSLS